VQTFHLPRHVSACRTDEGIVFLDTRHDRYFGFCGQHMDALGTVVQDWPGGNPPYVDPTSTPPAELQKMLQALVERGLITESTTGTPSEARTLAPPLKMLQPQVTVDRCRAATAIDVVNFLLACSRAAWRLKWQSIEDIMRELASVRCKAQHRSASSVATTIELAQVFRHLRRFFFSERNRCLFNALSLVYFLRRYEYFPLWVIGVKTAPFGAHSWVQQGEIALDGDPAVLCHFVPILAA
jgi:Transglutaminase-like superfamily